MRGRIAERLGWIPEYPLYATKVREEGLKRSDIIKLSSGETNFRAPDHVREAAKRAIDAGRTFYTSGLGIPSLRRAIARKIRADHGVDVDPETEVVITAGGIQAIFVAMMAVLNPGEEVIMADPTYVSYAVDASLLGARVVSVPVCRETAFEPDPSSVREKVGPSSKLLVLNSPCNPTGAVLSQHIVAELAEIARSRELLVLSDEAYEKMLYDGARHTSIISQPGMKERTILIGSFSKTYAMTGWRIGYIVAPADVCRAILKLQSYMVLCVNAVAQEAALAALEGPQSFVDEMVKELDQRRRLALEVLSTMPGVTCDPPKGAFYLWCDVSKLGIESFDLAMNMIREIGVAVYPGSAFGETGRFFIRIAYGAVGATELTRALTLMGEYFSALMHR